MMMTMTTYFVCRRKRMFLEVWDEYEGCVCVRVREYVRESKSVCVCECVCVWVLVAGQESAIKKGLGEKRKARTVANFIVAMAF
jgi:hypothetical protein